MEHLITAEEVKKCGRPIGRMVDDAKLNSFIEETEMLQIKPVLGDTLYLYLCEEMEWKEEERDDNVNTLLNGGQYLVKDARTGKEVARCFNGLKVTISYFVYAQNIMSGDYESTRFGTVMKQDSYSAHISDKQRSDNYNAVLEIAHSYLNDCVTYCKAVGLIKNNGRSKVNLGGISIKKIG